MLNINNNKLFQINKEKNKLGEPPSCFDDIVRSIAYMNNSSYEMFYSNRWYFKFNNQSDYALVDRVKIYREIDFFYEKLFELQGFSFKEIEIENFKRTSHELIANNNYIVAFIDGYWLPWDGYYQNRHNSHAIIILDITNDNNYICCDPYHNIDKIELNYNYFYSGLHKLLCPLINTIKTCPYNRLQYFKTIINELDKNMFNDIHNLSDRINEGHNVKELFLSLHIIAWNRWTFGIYLSSLKDIDPYFEYYGTEMEKISLKWNSIKLCLIKYECLTNINSSKSNSILHSICNSLHEVADMELLLYNKIVKKDFIITETKNNNIILSKNIFNIDIIPLFNNIGISNNLSIKDRSDLTGMGEYIVLENKEDSLIQIGNGKKYDNISCNGQNININKCYINMLIIIGCSEWGNYSEKFIINEMSNPVVLTVSISDYSSVPIFNEEVYTNGCAYVYNNELHKTWDKVSIYKVVIPIKCLVDTIKLPLCPNMHIMSLQYT